MMGLVVFGLETPRGVIGARKYFLDTKARLSVLDVKKNPYSEAKYRRVVKKEVEEHYFVLRPFYPEIYKFSFLPAIILFLPVWGWVKVIAGLISCLMFATIIFWNKKFTFFVLKKGAEKAGVNTTDWFLFSSREAVRRLI